MKLLTLNFLTCAIKTCKPLPSAFPLHIRDAELESIELDFNPLFLRNVMSRIEWRAMKTVLAEVGLKLPPPVLRAHIPPEDVPTDQTETDAKEDAEKGDVNMDVDMNVSSPDTEHHGEKADDEEEAGEDEVSEETLKKLHELLMETQIITGKLVCGNCGYEYAVREGIPNFLLPAHLV